MGLFSKKKLVCEVCGKEYEARIAVGEHVCPDCRKRKEAKEAEVQGYLDYSYSTYVGPYTEEDLDKIAAHRQGILDKYADVEKLTREEFKGAGDNYKKLSDEEAGRILIGKSNTEVSNTLGASYTTNFFIPSRYEKVIVDADDVFAIGYVNDYKVKDDGEEAILCAVFTNDPYIPAFPIVFSGKLGFLEVFKSKKGRKGVAFLLGTICHNLTYPVQELKKLKKEIKADGSVKGNIEYKQMIEFIDSANVSSGIFDTKKMADHPSYNTSELLSELGYIPQEEIEKLLKMDKMFASGYWKKQMENLNTDLVRTLIQIAEDDE